MKYSDQDLLDDLANLARIRDESPSLQFANLALLAFEQNPTARMGVIRDMLKGPDGPARVYKEFLSGLGDDQDDGDEGCSSCSGHVLDSDFRCPLNNKKDVPRCCGKTFNTSLIMAHEMPEALRMNAEETQINILRLLGGKSKSGDETIIKKILKARKAVIEIETFPYALKEIMKKVKLHFILRKERKSTIQEALTRLAIYSEDTQFIEEGLSKLEYNYWINKNKASPYKDRISRPEIEKVFGFLMGTRALHLPATVKTGPKEIVLSSPEIHAFLETAGHCLSVQFDFDLVAQCFISGRSRMAFGTLTCKLFDKGLEVLGVPQLKFYGTKKQRKRKSSKDKEQQA